MFRQSCYEAASNSSYEWVDWLSASVCGIGCVWLVPRLYKEHGPATIDALKRNPAVSVPLVLHRLQMKASELREARRSQQRAWNEVNEKYYLKSLDHQALVFKQTDTKQLRSKALLAEVEAAFDEVRWRRYLLTYCMLLFQGPSSEWLVN